MSRFARIVDESKKNEIIFFYFENLGDYTKKRTTDFSEEANPSSRRSRMRSMQLAEASG